MVEELSDLRRTLARQEPIAGRFEFALHFGQRNAAGADREIIQELRRAAAAQGAEFLDFAEAEREDVLERRFVEVDEDLFKLANVLGRAGVARQVQATDRAVAVGATPNFELAGMRFDPERAAAESAADRRQILRASFIVEAVQHGADEFEQGRLAGFVLAVQQRQARVELR